MKVNRYFCEEELTKLAIQWYVNENGQTEKDARKEFIKNTDETTTIASIVARKSFLGKLAELKAVDEIHFFLKKDAKIITQQYLFADKKSGSIISIEFSSKDVEKKVELKEYLGNHLKKGSISPAKLDNSTTKQELYEHILTSIISKMMDGDDIDN